MEGLRTSRNDSRSHAEKNRYLTLSSHYKYLNLSKQALSKPYQYTGRSDPQRSVAKELRRAIVLAPRALRIPFPTGGAGAHTFCEVEWPGPRRESGRPRKQVSLSKAERRPVTTRRRSNNKGELVMNEFQNAYGYGEPQFAPQGFFGGLLGAPLGGLIGRGVGGLLGNPRLGNQIGQFAGGIGGSLLPFGVDPVQQAQQQMVQQQIQQQQLQELQQAQLASCGELSSN